MHIKTDLKYCKSTSTENAHTVPYNSGILHFCFDISFSIFELVFEISMAFKMCVAFLFLNWLILF